MEIDPLLVAVTGALTTVAGMFYRHLLKEKEEDRAEIVFWRDRALIGTGLAEIAEAEAERRTP